LSRKRRLAGIASAVLVATALTAGGLWFLRPAPGPLDAVPSTSLVVVDADVRGLRASPLWERTEGFLRGSVPLDRLDAACGFATLSRLEHGVLTIGQGEAGGVGLALSGGIAKEEFLHCQTQLVIGAVGATKNQLAPTVSHGGFSLTQLRLADVELIVGLGLRRPLLIATPTWAERMADAADEPEKSSYLRLLSPAPRLPSPHDGVRARLEKEAAGLPLLLAASAKMPEGQGQLVASLLHFLPTAELVQRAKAIGEPKAAGVSLVTYEQGKRATLRLVVDAGSEASAAALRDVVLGTRLAHSQNIVLRLAGAGKLLDSISATTDGAWVIATIDDTTAAFGDHLTMLSDLRSGTKPLSR